MKGLFDLNEEILVADELWDFLGGKGTYPEFLNCFEEVGVQMREEIDNNFSKYQSSKRQKTGTSLF